MFTPNNVYNYCKNQLGITKDVYSSQFNQPAVGAYCCAFGCAAFLNSGKNIGYWANCGTTSDGGIQYGMKKAGFKQTTDYENLGYMWPIILDRPNGLKYDHFCFSLGEYRMNNGIKEIKTIGGNPNQILWFPLSQVVAAFIPNWDDGKGTGWYKDGEGYRHYTNGELDKNKVFKGEGAYKDNYYYVGVDGYIVKDKFKQYDGQWYYACKDGHIARNEIVQIKADSKGRLFT